MIVLLTTPSRPLKIDDYYVRQLASGLDELIFTMSVYDEDYPYIQEEAPLMDRNENRYIIKQIDAGVTDAKIIAQIDLNDWKSTLKKNYTNGSDTPYGTVNTVKPTGWSVLDSTGISTKRTIPTSSTAQPYNVTPLEILEAVENKWGIRARFDVINKIVTLINPTNYSPTGAFAIRDLNLKKLNYKGKSSGLVTRLYAEGKDGLTFASINGGNDYVDNNAYSAAVLCSYWKDERYTDKASLLADATKKLASMAVPQSSYSCDIIDIAKIDANYSYQNMSLFQKVTLIDDIRRTSVDHQVVERWEYPHLPEKNKIILSRSTPAIQNQVTQVTQAIETPTSSFQQIMQAFVDSQTQAITGNEGGNVCLHDTDADGKPNELLIMNTDDISTATDVWRWNMAGLGFSSTGYNGTYSTAITSDGKISADFITTGTLNAALVSVINLIANTVQSYGGGNTRLLEIMASYMDIRAYNNGAWRQRVGAYVNNDDGGGIRVSKGLVDANGTPDGASYRSFLFPNWLAIARDENDVSAFYVDSSGNVTAKGDVSASGKGTFGGNVTSGGKGTFTGDLKTSGDLDVDGGATIDGKILAPSNCTELYNDVNNPFTSGSGIITLVNAKTKYHLLVFIGNSTSNSSNARQTITVPVAFLTTTDQGFEVAESASVYAAVNIKISGNNIVISWRGGTGSFYGIYGV